jgi:hypothetical protein
VTPGFSEEPKDDRDWQDEFWYGVQDPDWGPDETAPSREDD